MSRSFRENRERNRYNSLYKRLENDRERSKNADARWKKTENTPYRDAICRVCKHFDRCGLPPETLNGYCTRGHVRYGLSQTFRPKELKRVPDGGWCEFWTNQRSPLDDPQPGDPLIIKG